MITAAIPKAISVNGEVKNANTPPNTVVTPVSIVSMTVKAVNAPESSTLAPEIADNVAAIAEAPFNTINAVAKLPTATTTASIVVLCSLHQSPKSFTTSISSFHHLETVFSASSKVSPKILTISPKEPVANSDNSFPTGTSTFSHKSFKTSKTTPITSPVFSIAGFI